MFRVGHGRDVPFATALLVVLTFAGSLPMHEAQAQSVSSKRKEAARVDARIEATSNRIAALDEDSLIASQRLAKLKKRLAQSEAEGVKRSARITKLQDALYDQALQMYTNPSGAQLSALEKSNSMSEAERRRILAETGTQRLADAADLLAAEREDQQREQKALARAREEAAATTALLKKQKAEADRLYDELQVLEKKVDGELATLIEQERVARERAEARRRAAEEKKRLASAKRALEARRRAERDAALRRRGRGSGNGARVAQSPVTRNRRDNSGDGPATNQGQGTDIDVRPLEVDPPLNRRGNAEPDIKQLEIDAGAVEVSSSPGASSAVQLAMGQIGKPYVWGAQGPGSFDCSGLMLYAWRAAGRSLPHSSRAQFASTTRVPVGQIRPGDLVFYGRPIHHVGMYIGNGQMVEASRRGVPVRVRSIFRKDMVGVGRV